MEAIFTAFDISGVATDARAAILGMLALIMIVVALVYIKSVLFGGGHMGGLRDDD